MVAMIRYYMPGVDVDNRTREELIPIWEQLKWVREMEKKNSA
jgi:hypothetical protein